jgi:hypothetical protein
VSSTRDVATPIGEGADRKDGSTQPTLTVRIQLNEFMIPPVTDALVIGKKAPIGSEALRKALSLLHVSPFEQIDFPDDETVEDLLVRRSVLKKVPRDKLISLILRRVKPYMTNEEVLHLNIKVEVTLEDQLW